MIETPRKFLSIFIMMLLYLSSAAAFSQWSELGSEPGRTAFGTVTSINQGTDLGSGTGGIVTKTGSNNSFGADSASRQSSIMTTMLELQSNSKPASLATYQSMSRSELIETRILLEQSLDQGGIDRSQAESLLFQFDSEVARPALEAKLGGGALKNVSFLEPLGQSSIETLPNLEISYLSALDLGDNDKALGIRNQIINTKAAEFAGAGIDPIQSYEMAQSYLSLSTDSIAIAAGLDRKGLNEVITKGLVLQGLASSQVNGTAAKLLAMATSPKDVGRAIPYGSDEFSTTLRVYNSGVPESNKWLVTSRVGKSEDELTKLLADDSLKSVIGMGKKSGGASLLEDIGNPFREADGEEADDEGSDPGAVSTQLSKDSFAWAKNITLGQDDLILNMLKRWFGGPVTALHEYITNSNGTFKSVVGQGGSLRASDATASYTALTLILFFVLAASVVLASFYFLYGLYKGGTEGTFFGQQHDTGMVLGRGVISLAGNLPVPGLLGLTVIQAFIFFGIFLSLGIAGGMAKTMTGEMLSKPIITPVPVVNESFFGSVVKSQVCLALLSDEDELKESEKGVAYFKATFDLLGNVENSEKGRAESVKGDRYAVYKWVRSFFVSDVDPLDSSADRKDRMDYIDTVYKDKGFSLTHEVARYRFGEGGRCGEFFVAAGAGDISASDMQAINSRMKGGAGSSANINKHEGSLNNVSKKDYESLQTTAQDLYDQWSREIEAFKLVEGEKLIDSMLVDVKADAEVIVDDFLKGGFGVKSSASTRSLREIEREFYDAWGLALFNEMKEKENPSDALIVGTIKDLGMGALGGIYWLIDLRQKQILDFYNFSLDSSSLVQIGGSDPVNNTDFKERLTSIFGYIEGSFGSTGVKKARMMLNSSAAGNSAADDSIDSLENWIFESDWFADINNFNGSPIERVRHLGNTLQAGLVGTGMAMVAAESYLEGYKVAKGDGFRAGFAAAALKILVRAYEVFQSVAGTLFIGAFICSSIIPAMPYIMFTAAIIGLLVHYASFLVGVPVWWMQKMHLNGNDMLGQSGPGYTLFLLLIMRAPLIVIGFFLGMGLNWIAGQFINLTFLPAMTMNSAGGYNLTGYVGEVLIFSGLHLFACYKSFHLTWEIPNFVASLIGSPAGSDLGENEMKGMALGFAHQGGGGAGAALTKFSPEKPDKDGDGDEDGDGDGGGVESGSPSSGGPQGTPSGGGGGKPAGKYNQPPPAESAGNNRDVDKPTQSEPDGNDKK